MSLRTIVAVALSAPVIAFPLFATRASAGSVSAALYQSQCQDAAAPSDDPAATPPVVVLRGSSAPPEPWYTPPPPSAPTDVDVSNVPYPPPYDGPPSNGLPYYYDYYWPYAHFVRPQRVVPDHRPAAGQFYRR
jgi:hypothetical protein